MGFLLLPLLPGPSWCSLSLFVASFASWLFLVVPCVSWCALASHMPRPSLLEEGVGGATSPYSKFPCCATGCLNLVTALQPRAYFHLRSRDARLDNPSKEKFWEGQLLLTLNLSLAPLAVHRECRLHSLIAKRVFYELFSKVPAPMAFEQEAPRCRWVTSGSGLPMYAIAVGLR